MENNLPAGQVDVRVRIDGGYDLHSFADRLAKALAVGLVAKVLTPDGKHDQKAGWLITARGWAFLRGEAIPKKVKVFRNDAISLAEIKQLAPDYLVISPGPCTPSQAGISLAAIREFAGKIPLLGVCLGHQAIGEAFGGRVVSAQKLMHGKVSAVQHLNKGVFFGLPNPLACTRYHSLALERASLPDALEITAWTDDGEIMGVRHKTLAVEGVQFHPESILSEAGHDLLKNFLTS